VMADCDAFVESDGVMFSSQCYRGAGDVVDVCVCV